MTRNPYFDNAKAILMVLVILGHTFSPIFNENKWITTIYLFIYLFHMPAFILVSGFFAKRVTNMKDIFKLAKKMLLPYLFFQIIYSLYYHKIYGDHIDFSVFNPRWALWFLVSLFCWNLMLTVFGKKKIGILLSVVLSLMIGYIGTINEALALSRTFFFFPFYLLGYFIENKHFEWIKRKSNVIISGFSLCLLFLLIYFYGDIEWREWIYGRLSYKSMLGDSIIYGFLYRLIAYVFMAIATYCFLSLVPKKQLPITKIGSITFIIYLFHMFIIKYINESFIYEWIVENQQYYLLLLVPVLVIYLLTRKPVIFVGSKILGMKIKG